MFLNAAYLLIMLHFGMVQFYVGTERCFIPFNLLLEKEKST